jgi:hypothetical protein
MGDVLVASVYWDRSRQTSVAAPSGWVLVRQDASLSFQGLSIYYHVVGGTEPVSYVWTASASSGFSGIITAYSGVDTSNPIDVVGGRTGMTGSPSAPSVTTTAANGWLIGVWSTWSSQLTLRPPTGMTLRQRFSEAVPLLVADKPLTVAGTTGIQAANMTGTAGPWTGQVIALRAR